MPHVNMKLFWLFLINKNVIGGIMEDYQEQQEDEIEALKSIFDSDLTGLWKLLF